MIDKVKIAAAILILIAGIVGYYQLPSIMGQDVSILIRVGLTLTAVLLAVGVAATSGYGSALIEFSKGSRIELRKMVWPTRAETVQTTIIVLILVTLVALILWGFDAVIVELIYDQLLGIDN